MPVVQAVVRHGFGGFKGFYNPVDRDDAAQAIFAAAFSERARLGYNGLDPYASFLRGIAKNVVRQQLEKRKRFERVPDPELQPHADGTLEDAYIEHETRAICRRFAESLSDDKERLVLQRYFCDGLAEEKLAVELDLTRYRTRKIIKRLHKRMRKYLEAHGITSA